MNKKKKDGNYIVLKKPIHQKDTKIVNLYARSVGVPKIIRQTLLNIREKLVQV
jgi:hypothetical protein